MSVRIITDSTSDLTPEVRVRVGVIPLSIRFGEEEYIDGVTITTDEFYRKLSGGSVLPTTSQATPASFEKLFRETVEAGDTAVVITIASGLSGTYQSGVIAAEDYPGKIFVVDSENVAIGAGILVEYALKLADQGMEADRIAAELTKLRSKVYLVAVVDTLEYLRKGGRIGRVASMLGSVLNLKPIISCDADGAYYVVSKARGRVKSIAETVALALKQVQGNAKYCIAVANGSAREEAAKLAQELRQRLPDAQLFLECEVSPALGVHTGPGLLGIGVQVGEG